VAELHQYQYAVAVAVVGARAKLVAQRAAGRGCWANEANTCSGIGFSVRSKAHYVNTLGRGTRYPSIY
jgi:hypothetical protein